MLCGVFSDCDIMASGSLDATCASETSEATEECSGKKKSKFQTFKNFFVKKKRKDSPTPLEEGIIKGSQSTDDIIATDSPVVQTLKVIDLGSMGNKAVSHDSVFVSDSPSSERNKALGASQDSIHGKVKSLQQQLKHSIRLGSPPALICGRKADDTGAFSDDDGLPCSPPEYSSLHTVLATPPHTASNLTQRGSCLSMETYDSDDDQMSYDSYSRPSTPQGPIPADFSLPANTDGCLDNTAARHRIAVKAKACTRRKPVSRHTRDLREQLLLKETEDKLRIVTSIVEEESEYSPMIPDTSSIASEPDEVPDSTQSPKTSPKSSISAGDVSEEEERASDNHVHRSEVSAWENPDTLQLQTDDFLLDTGCEVVPKDQGSLLEEVLSSLKNPLVSGIAVENESMVLQNEVADVKTEIVEANQEDKDLLSLLESKVSTKEPVAKSDSRSTVDSQQDIEETLTVSIVVPQLARKETKASVEKQPQKVVKEETKIEFKEKPEASTVNVKKHSKGIVKDKSKLESETKVDEDKTFRDLAVVEFEKRDVGKPQDIRRQSGSSQTEKDDSRKSTATDIENIALTAQSVKADVLKSETSNHTKTNNFPSVHPVEVISSSVSPKLDSPVLHSQFSNISPHPLEEPSKANVASRLQEVSSANIDVGSEQKDVLEQTTNDEVRPRFTIAPAWQRSVTKENLQTVSSLVAETDLTKTSNESLQTTEFLTPGKEERSKPARTQSTPTYHMRKERHVQDESTSENRFGVRLRKTAVLHRYGLEGESPQIQAESETRGRSEVTDTEQHGKKTVLPKKSDLIVDAVMSSRKVQDPVGRVSVGDTESPSWISMARQKHLNFIENSPETSPDQHNLQDFNHPSSLPSLSNSVTQEQLVQPCSAIKVFCSIEISNPSMVEKENKRSAITSTPPLPQDEPPWMALAKKKAKAWSEMPQIVQ